MNKLFYYELLKIWKNRIVVCVFLFMLLLNPGIKMLHIFSDNQSFSLSERRRILSEMSELTVEDVIRQTEQLYDETDNDSFFRTDLHFYMRVKLQAEQIQNYDTSLSHIQREQDSYLIISKLQVDGTYLTRQSDKIKKVYEKLQAISLPFDSFEGLNEYADYYSTAILLLIFIFFLTHAVFLPDESGETDSFERTVFYGRRPQMLAKIGAAVLISALAVLLMTLENMLIFSLAYGFGDITRPIQSVLGFGQCPYRISVSEYLVYSALLKIAAAVIFAALFSVILICSRKTAISLCLCGLIVMAFAVCCSMIHEASWLVWLKYVNPFSLLLSDLFFSNLRLLNTFSYPVNILPAALCVLAVFCTVCFCFVVFRGRSISGSHVRSLKLLKIRHTPAGKLLPLQCFKIFWMDMGLLIFMITLLVSFLFTHYYREYLTSEEARYRSYMHVMSGMNLDNAKVFIDQENEKFERLHQELTDLIVNGTKLSEPAAIRVLRKLEMEEGFERAKESVLLLNGRKGAVIVYETGYSILFNAFGIRQNLSYFLEFLAITALILQGISNDRSSGIKHLLRSTIKGREYLEGITLLHYFLFMTALCTGLHVMELYGILRDYGINGLLFQGNSLPFFRPDVKIPIVVCIGLFSLLRTLIASIMMLVTFGLFNLLKTK